MKILAIHIRNLASLSGEHTIDFKQEPLASTGIFAITGATGAGKSTILDALCLALYDKAPRFEHAENIKMTDISGKEVMQGDVGGILRDGTASGYAKVDFVGMDGKSYQAAWQIKRAYNKVDGRLQSSEMTLKNIETDQFIPGKKRETLEAIEEKVGLNFDQFTRSVLLAQGDFTAFMKAKKEEKSALLEKLTGTSVYTLISKKVFEKHREEKNILDSLNERTGFIELIHEEEMMALKSEQKELRKGITRKRTEVQKAEQDKHRKEHFQSLEKELAAAQDEYNLAMDQKKAAAERTAFLQRIKNIQEARPLKNKLQESKESLSREMERLKELKAEESELLSTLENKEKEVKSAETGNKSAIQKQEESVPLLKEAGKLDNTIEQIREQLLTIEKELEAGKNKVERIADDLSREEKKLTRLIEKKGQAVQWLEHNKSRQLIAEREDIIEEKLENATGILSEKRKLSGQLKDKNKDAADCQERIEELKAEKDKKLTAFASEEKLYKKLLKNITGLPVEEWEKQKDERTALLQELTTAQSRWTLLFQTQNECRALQNKIAESEKEKVEKEKEVKEVAQAEEKAKLEKDAKKQMWDTAFLESTKNVVSLRSGLKNNEPCPVCGSREHPYTKKDEQLNNVLSALQEKYNISNERYEGCREKRTGIQHRIKSLSIEIDAQSEERKLKKSLLEKYSSGWNELSMKDKAEAIEEEQRTAWLEQQILEEKSRQEDLQKRMRNYKKVHSETEQLKEQLEGRKTDIQKITEVVTVKEGKSDIIRRDIRHLKENLENAESNLAQIKQSISDCFPSENWFTNWENNPESFVIKIQDFAKEWKAKEQTIQDCGSAILTAENQIKNTKDRLKEAQDALDERKETQKSTVGHLYDLQKQRKRYFEGETVETIERQLKQAVREAEQLLREKKEDYQNLQIRQTRVQAHKKTAEQNKVDFEKQQSLSEQALQDWIAAFNTNNAHIMSDKELDVLLACQQDWINKEEKELSAIDSSCTKAETRLSERKKDVDIFISEGIPLLSIEELTAKLETTKEHLDDSQSRLHQIKYQLEDDRKNREKRELILKEIRLQESVAEQWAKLSELIGSADGKKFREIAQSYTLEVLLTHANVHLEKLSRRYRLERIPDTLGLQVIDQDMGDEIRTVLSLSGGESFIVSLALALGLASLSSGKMQVESLFIDEGFGSLDPSTLNIVMDALERLYNQGRKVGVISHVEDMTERIPVQIQVTKTHGGKSLLEVKQM